EQAAVGELGRERGEVAAVDAERVGQLRLAGLPERLQLLEHEERLSAEAERPHGAPHARGGVPADRGEQLRHRDIEVNYHSGNLPRYPLQGTPHGIRT